MNGHAVIIGGGIGGLLAAHALAGRFERITVLERYSYPPDSISPAPPARRGVPQSRCLHLLMAAGAAAFDELAPGWREELVARGARPFDACADALVRFSTGWLPRTPSGITAYACSRALLEKVLRHGLAGKSTVHVREGQTVMGLLSSPMGERVIGVHTADREAAVEKRIEADLVVDASGANSMLPHWLSRLSNTAGSQLQKTVVESGTEYVSRWFRLDEGDAPDWHCLSIAPAAGAALRSAMMLRAEGDRWGVVLLAPPGESLPSDDMAFLDFVAGLGDGELREALARATPVSPVHRYGPTSNRMTHYDRVTDWPTGLVAIGDSVCTLDPYFGLGMTAAARGAVLLGRYGKARGEISGPKFQKELASLNAEPWGLASGRDPEGRPLARDVRYISRLYKLAPSSPQLAHALLAVQHLLRPAETLKELTV
jgi:2-polyprenyl-6-methoxyphenol hydroxylase-like FAD-dependent oxidoreductase